MSFEFDHLFICTDVDAREADCLVSFGLSEGTSNIHPGQGTTNRRFFFPNAMLELLWVCDPAEAQSAPIQRTHLWERWFHRRDGVCPFGICLRATDDSGDAVAFSSWEYRPPYLSADMSIAVGTNSEILTEPMLFQTSFSQRPDRFPAERSQPLNHPAGLREITRVELVSPVTESPSPELQAVLETELVRLRQGVEYLVELGFDREQQRQKIDFRPQLPLILSW